MVKRRTEEEPTSRLATWARRLAVFSVAATLMSVVVVRARLLELGPAMATFIGAMAIAGLAVLMALVAIGMVWQLGVRGFGRALVALLLGSALLAYPGYLAVRAYRLPWISDVTTDPIDPPIFQGLAAARLLDGKRPEYAGLHVAEQQRIAYPEIVPLVVDVRPVIAYELASAAVNKRRWRIVGEQLPQAGAAGRIEAIALTTVLGFADDVILRVRADGTGSRIDIRSASRFEAFDVGANADRVRSLIATITEAVDALPPDQSETVVDPDRVPLPRNRPGGS